MGDRANIIVAQDFNGNRTSIVYLYTQWNGDWTPVFLQDGLRRGRKKWQMADCLARVLFAEMIRDDVNNISGFGISSIPLDNERHWLLVNCNNLTVSVIPSSIKGSSVPHVEPIASWSFSEYCELNLDNGSPYVSAEPWDVLLPDGE